jgi:hypothetical protein
MTRDPVSQSLLASKLGDLLTWKPPDIAETVGPYDPSLFKFYDTQRGKIVEDCEAFLRDCSEEQLKALTDRTSDDPEGIRAEWRNFREIEIRKLTRMCPPWYAGGFGHSDHVADFDYWGKMSSFTLHEILCLSLGIEPDSFRPEKIADMTKKKDISDLWPPLQFLVRRNEQLTRRFNPRWRVIPKELLDWIEEMEFETHPELVRSLRQYHSGKPKSSPADSAVADKREIRMIAQLFAAMAIEYYGYDPKQARSPVTKEIADLAAFMGLSISEDTVRKYLKMGASLIPKDWYRNRRRSKPD